MSLSKRGRRFFKGCGDVVLISLLAMGLILAAAFCGSGCQQPEDAAPDAGVCYMPVDGGGDPCNLAITKAALREIREGLDECVLTCCGGEICPLEE